MKGPLTSHRRYWHSARHETLPMCRFHMHPSEYINRSIKGQYYNDECMPCLHSLDNLCTFIPANTSPFHSKASPLLLTRGCAVSGPCICRTEPSRCIVMPPPTPRQCAPAASGPRLPRRGASEYCIGTCSTRKGASEYCNGTCSTGCIARVVMVQCMDMVWIRVSTWPRIRYSSAVS